MINFNARLKSIRKASNATQKQVAIAINTSEQNYQRYERGTQQPTLPTLVALADYFNVSIDYLAGRSDVPNADESIKKQPRTIEDAGLEKVVDDYNKCDEHGKETIQHIAHSEAERTHKQQYVVLEGIVARGGSGTGKVEMPREKFEKILKEIGLRPEDLNK